MDGMGENRHVKKMRAEGDVVVNGTQGKGLWVSILRNLEIFANLKSQIDR